MFPFLLVIRYVERANHFNRPGSYPGSEAPPSDNDWRGRFDCYGRSMLALRIKDDLNKCQLEMECTRVPSHDGT